MKKTTLIAAAMLIAACARADYLYWMVNEDSQSQDSVPFMYAKVAVSGEGVAEETYLVDGFGNDEVLWSGFPTPETGYSTAPAYFNLGSYGAEGFSFAVELYGVEGDLVGRGDIKTFEQLRDFVYGDMGHGGIDPWVVSSTAAVPEPTGGVLVLFGCALLALRRRRVEARG